MKQKRTRKRIEAKPEYSTIEIKNDEMSERKKSRLWNEEMERKMFFGELPELRIPNTHLMSNMGKLEEGFAYTGGQLDEVPKINFGELPREQRLALLKTRRFPSSTYNTQSNVLLAAKLKENEA